jgi:hypothetical protein
MSTAEHQPQEFPNDPIKLALLAFDESQAVYFEKVERWSHIPTKHRLDEVAEATQSFENSFVHTARMIIRDGEIDTHEKAQFISTLFLGSDSQRVTNFSRLAPKGSFKAIPLSHDTLTGKIEEIMTAAEADIIIEQLRNQFAGAMELDKSLLLNNHMRYRMVRVLGEGASQTKDVGKIAAGVLIANIITQQLRKKNR